MEFKTKLLFENSQRLMKLYPKKSKKGETYFMGEFNKMFKATMWKRKGYKDGDDFYEVSLVPIKYEKTDSAEPKQDQGFTEPTDEEDSNVPF